MTAPVGWGLWAVLLLVFVSFKSAKSAEIVQVESLHVTSYISYRFATTHVTSRLLNGGSSAQEIGYEVQLPQAAFISNFSMLIDGKVYPGSVKEKAKAKKQYERAKERGESAGHVVAKSRTANMFRVSVNIASDKAVTFNLTYQELLKRRLGYYEHVIYIDPGQTVADMRVEVFMLESRPITSVVVPPIRTDIITENALSKATNTLTVIERPTANSAYISYQPSEAQQRAKRDAGIQGQFVVKYDVERDTAGSDVLVFNGYFVHFVAPKGLTPIPRDVLFVLDISGSMQGIKMAQVKQAMLTILADLHSRDRFNLAFFSNRMRFWKQEFLLVSNSTIINARKYVKTIQVKGGTNMYDGLVKGIEFFATKGDRNRAAIMIFLTDGQATAGIRDNSQIIDKTTRKNEGVVALFGLAFGNGADYGLIKSVSARNHGVARKIYVESDAKLQVTGFYDEVSTPLLSNVTVKYVGDGVNQTSLTQNQFFNYYEGAELVIAGQLDSDTAANTIRLYITAEQADGLFLESETITPSAQLSTQQLGFGEDITAIARKLWAYLAIKQLLAKLDTTDNPAEIADIKRRALDLSLQQGFVTPLTSMVVTKESRGRSKRPWLGGGPSRGGSADGDPHFIVPLTGASHPVCFDVMGNNGDVFQLISDPKTGIYANARMFEVNVTKAMKIHHEPETNGANTTLLRRVYKNVPRRISMRREYMNAITVMAPDVMISVSTTRIVVQRVATGERQRLKWKQDIVMNTGNVRVTVHRQHRVTMEIGRDVTLRVIKHRQVVVFLGLYVDNGGGFSRKVGGLLGEFRYKRVTETPIVRHGQAKRALLTVRDATGNDHIATVHLTHRMDLATNSRVGCWSLNQSDRQKNILNLSPERYIVPKLNTKYVRKRSGA